MGKPNNVVDFAEARARRQADLKSTSKAIKQALDRIENGKDKIPKKNKRPYFKDYPLITKELGCKTASALFSRLEYRFNIMPGGFYKFLAPSKNRAYRKGDSLLEEMPGVNIRTLQRAFKKIVTSYKSQSLYLSAKDELGDKKVFKGNPYLSYYNKKTNKMFYLRNKAFFALLNKGKNPFKRKMPDWIKLPHKRAVLRALKVKSVISWRRQNVISRDVAVSSPKTPQPAVYKAPDPSTKNTYKEYSLSISLSDEKPQSEVTIQHPIREREIKNDLGEQPEMHGGSDMFKIWVKHTGPMNGLSPKKSLLEECLSDHFNGSLDEWEGYCKLIAKSKFLMGESGKGNWKAFLGWAIKPENIEDVLSGDVYDQDRSNSYETIPDRKKITEDEEREILSLDIPETIRELRLSLLRVMGGCTYRSWMKRCLIDQIDGHSVDFKPDGKFATEYVCTHHKDYILRSVGDMFQNVTIGGENLYVRK